jgi:redox-sensing transcriptional repressor
MEHHPTPPSFPDLPEATVARLPEYLRALHQLADNGHDTVSSEDLARAAGVSSAKLRKDLSQLGSYGVRGVGYEVAVLVSQIEQVLGLTTHRNVAVIGVGNLGRALAGYAGFAERGFRISALVDIDPARVGQRLGDVTVTHLDDLAETVAANQIAIGVIATPAHAAQLVADRLVAAGVTSILNFAPCVLRVPPGVDVRKVDLAIELQILSFHENRKAAARRRADRPAPAVAGHPETTDRPAVTSSSDGDRRAAVPVRSSRRSTAVPVREGGGSRGARRDRAASDGKQPGGARLAARHGAGAPRATTGPGAPSVGTVTPDRRVVGWS